MEVRWHKLFRLGIYVKTIIGFLEFASGLLFLFISKSLIVHFFTYFTADELLEEPNDWLINFFQNQLQHLSVGSQYFAAFYIVFHGIVNLALAWGLYRERIHTYILAIATIIFFMLYQVFRFSHTHAVGLLLITAIDALFVIVVWHEYQFKLKLRRQS